MAIIFTHTGIFIYSVFCNDKKHLQARPVWASQLLNVGRQMSSENPRYRDCGSSEVGSCPYQICTTVAQQDHR